MDPAISRPLVIQVLLEGEKIYEKNKLGCRREILGTKYTIAQPSLLTAGLVPSVTHICSSLHRCPLRCQGTLPWDRGQSRAGSACLLPSAQPQDNT